MNLTARRGTEEWIGVPLDNANTHHTRDVIRSGAKVFYLDSVVRNTTLDECIDLVRMCVEELDQDNDAIDIKTMRKTMQLLKSVVVSYKNQNPEKLSEKIDELEQLTTQAYLWCKADAKSIQAEFGSDLLKTYVKFR